MSDLLSMALKAMNSTGLTSNAFTQENKQPVVEQPKVEEPEIVTINTEEK
jgi:hypothetical protein